METFPARSHSGSRIIRARLTGSAAWLKSSRSRRYETNCWALGGNTKISPMASRLARPLRPRFNDCHRGVARLGTLTLARIKASEPDWIYPNPQQYGLHRSDRSPESIAQKVLRCRSRSAASGRPLDRPLRPCRGFPDLLVA